MTHILEQWEKESRDNQRLVAEEEFILQVTEQIWEKLDSLKMNQADLANAMETTRPNVSQLLNGTRNMTLRKLAAIAFALELRPHVVLEERGSKDQDWKDDQVVLQLDRTVRMQVVVPATVSNSQDWSSGFDVKAA